MTIRRRRSASPADPIKAATIDALNQVLEPLIELMLDAGVTVHEFNQLVRERAVRVAMKRLIAVGEKRSKSRAAIMTGLPRSEVASILRSSESTTIDRSDQLPARRILAVWNDNPRYSEPNGTPSVLPIFGKMLSFEQLVSKYGGGIPVRAMLDELIQMQAVELLQDQRVRVRVRVPQLTGMTPQSVAAVGQRSYDLLQTLAHNRRQPFLPLFEATAISNESDVDMISLVRREITAQGIDFINGATSLLNRSELKRSAKDLPDSTRRRVGVTVFYFEDEGDVADPVVKNATKSRRKNLRRHPEIHSSLKTAAR